MAEFTGKDLVVSWIYSGGTVTLTADYHTFAYTPSIEKFNTRAGNESANTYLTGASDFTATYDGLAQAGGTATEDALKMGTYGTIIVQPEGTAAGKRKYTFPAFCDKDPLTSFAYNDLVHLQASWQGNGAYTLTTN